MGNQDETKAGLLLILPLQATAHLPNDNNYSDCANAYIYFGTNGGQWDGRGEEVAIHTSCAAPRSVAG